VAAPAYPVISECGDLGAVESESQKRRTVVAIAGDLDLDVHPFGGSRDVGRGYPVVRADVLPVAPASDLLTAHETPTEVDKHRVGRERLQQAVTVLGVRGVDHLSNRAVDLCLGHAITPSRAD
jgi:hypothetical protein